MISKFVFGILLFSGLTACGNAEACKDGRLVADFLASPIDGGGAVISNGKPVPVSAGYHGHKRIAEVARSSRFEFFHVPLRVKSRCKYIDSGGTLHIELSDIETLRPIADDETFNRLYAEFGIEPVALGSESPSRVPE